MHESNKPLIRHQRRGPCLPVLALLAACAMPSAAQDTFAGKPVRMVVSVGAGGATDTLTRMLGERLALTVQRLKDAVGVLKADKASA